MMERIAETSPRFKARIAGVFQLLEAVTAAFGQVIVLDRLVVSGNAAATAANILAHEPLFWLGFASSLIGVVFHIAWALLFYELLKPVNRSVSLLAAFVILVGCAVQALTSLFYLAPLLILQGGSSLSAFTPEQLQALALVFLRLRAAAYHNIGLVFFGLYCLLVGILILRSRFLPRILGVLMALAGLSYMPFLSAPLVRSLQPYILIFPGVGQISLTLWLLVMGVNVQRWKDKASAA